MSVRRSLLIVIVLSSVAAVCAPIPASAADVFLRPPVDAPVLDPFRLPDGPYGPGNRGIEYDTRAGASIAAAGAGIVVFAGPVAGTLHVTIDHGSGLRTSYSFVAAITVRRGDVVAAGARVAEAGGPFHFGARLHGTYIDPATIMGRAHLTVALVPHSDPALVGRWLALQERSERVELAALLGWERGGGFGLGDVVGGIRSVVSVAAKLDGLPLLDARGRIDELLRLADIAVTLLAESSPAELVSLLADVAMAVVWPPPCTPGHVEPTRPSGRRIALVLDGLGSSSDGGEAMSQLDLGIHGYAEADIVRFSYAGGIVPDDRGDLWIEVPATAYGPADTQVEIDETIGRLGDTMVALAEANPGVEIDVYGHSLGGLISRHAIAEVAGPGGPVDIGVAVTFASPHSGAPAAEIAEALTASEPGRALDRGLDLVHPDNAVGTEVLEGLSVSGFAGDTADVAFPEGVRALTIGDRGDLVVPASRASAPGAHHVVVGGLPSLTAHSDLPGVPEVHREIDLAMAGLPPTCTGAMDRALDVLQPGLIEQGELHVAKAVLVGGLVLGGP